MGGPTTKRRRSSAGISTYGRKKRHYPLVILALIALGAAGFAMWWAYSRPIPVHVSATPTDCTIVAFSTESSGTVDIADIEPGAFRATISRPGFKTLETEIEVERFSANEFSFELEPLPQSISVVAHPENATCRLLVGDDEVSSATGSLATTIAAGTVTLEVSCDGCNTFTRELMLDQTTALEVWLDPEGQLVHSLGILESSGAPKGVAITPDNTQMWATVLDGPPSVEIYDIDSMRRISTIDLAEHGAVEVVFSSDGSRAYVSQMETALVYEIDTETLEILRTLDTESAWSKVVELSPDERTLYVANWSGDDVSIIDLDSGVLRQRVATADTPRGLWATQDGTALYVAGFGGGELQRIDLASGTVTDLFDSDGALRHIVGAPERGVLYVSDMARDCIWLHDVVAGTTTKFIDTDEKPNTIDLSEDGRVLYVSCRGENNSVSYYLPGPEWGTILLFDARTGEPLDAIVGGNQCTALDISPDGTTLVFSDFLDSRMRLYSVPSYEELTAGDGGRWEAHFADLKK